MPTKIDSDKLKKKKLLVCDGQQAFSKSVVAKEMFSLEVHITISVSKRTKYNAVKM